MEQRKVARLTRTTLLIRELLTVQRPVTNGLNHLTSQVRSSFHKSLSAQVPHLSPAPQETTEPFRSQQGAGFGQLGIERSPRHSFSIPKDFFPYGIFTRPRPYPVSD